VKDSLRAGVSNTVKLIVDRDRTISFMGDEGRVYATPRLVHDIEHACRDLLLQHADADEDSVGIEISLRHLAATPLGTKVEITATVSEVDRRRVIFSITARDEVEPIAEGTHQRFVVGVAQRQARLRDKLAKLAQVRGT
jgi:predicted thioesterase